MVSLLKINKKMLAIALVAFMGVFCMIKRAEASISVARAFYELASANNAQKIESQNVQNSQ